MTRLARLNTEATAAINTAAAIEDWMCEAYNTADASRTAHAIRNAATEARAELVTFLDAYADGYGLDIVGLRSMDSAMRSVIEWASMVAC